MKATLAEFLLQHTTDAAELSRRAQTLAALAQLPPRRRNELAKAVDEVCRAITARGGTALVRFSIVQRDGRRWVEVSVTDQRPYEAEPCSAEEGRQAATGEIDPICIQRIGELVDHFESSGWPFSGTVIRMGQRLSPAFALPTESEFADWSEMLKARSPLDALAMALQRSHSLAEALGHARDREQLREKLNQRASTAEQLTMLSLVIGKTRNAISLMRADGTVTWVNNAFVQMTGYSPDEATGKRLDELLFGPSTDAQAVRDLQRAMQRGEELTQDALHYRRDGQMFWADCNTIPVRDSNGQLRHWIAIASDITRRRQTEDALREARDIAETNSRAKSEFLANLSHEIRTPMNAIIGMTELALGTDLTNQQTEYLETVQASAEGLLQLLNNILDLSKIEAGKLQIEEVDFDLRALITQTLNAMSGAAGAKGIKLDAHIPSELPHYVRGDSTRLRQVLFNLVGNAIKFTERGSVRVSVEGRSMDDEQLALHFSVHDTGIGISPDKLDRIFEAFAQADSTTTRRFGGTGLGLTITAELVRLMHGRIWVESAKDEGSTFHFTTRVERGSAPQALEHVRTGNEAEKSLALTHVAPAPLRVLVADDHDANRQLVATVLTKRGHHVVEVTDGAKAVAAVARESFDVVLMDVQMPTVDGLAATTAIRASELQTGRHVPIIALTAHAMKGDREKCLAAGMDAYLAKPLRPRDLITLVETMGSGRTQAEEDVQATTDSATTPRPFSFAAALESLDNDAELLTEQMRFFQNDGPQLLQRVQEAIDQRDARQMEIAAHRLKGLLARYAYHDAAGLAYDLERMGREAEFDPAQAACRKLKPLVDLLVNAIDDYVAKYETEKGKW